MEEIKRKHRKKRTLAELKAERAALDVEIEEKEKAETYAIGREVQTTTGLQTLEEIRPVILKAVELLRETAAQPGQSAS